MFRYLNYLTILLCPIILLFMADPSVRVEASTLQENIFHQRTLRFQRILFSEGLPFQPITCIYEDRDGYMWFGSDWGLCRYNGYEFRIFSSESVQTIAEDSLGRLWLGTPSGVFCLSRDRTKIVYGLGDIPLTDFDSKQLLIGRDGSLWILAQRETYRLNTETLEVQSFTFPHRSESLNEFDRDDYINPLSITEDLQGRVWIGTDAGLYFYRPEIGEMVYHPVQVPLHTGEKKELLLVTCLITSKSGMLYMNGFMCGLVSLDPITMEVKSHWIELPKDTYASIHLDVISIMEDHTGTLWVGSLYGLHRFDPDTGQYSWTNVNPNQENSITSFYINKIFQSRSGMIWIATQENLYRYSPYLFPFQTLIHNLNDPSNSLSAQKVYSLCEDALGNIWIGTLGGGLDCYNPKTHTFKNYRHDPENPLTLSEDTVTALCADPSGKIWVGTWNYGLNLLDPETGEVKRFPFVNGRYEIPNENTLAHNVVRAIEVDRHGKIWIGTEFNGLSILNPQTGKFTHYTFEKDNPNALSHHAIRSFYLDRLETMWIGTGGYLEGGRGFNRYLEESDSFEQYYGFFPERSTLNKWVIDITEDRQGRIWIATNMGLFQVVDRQDQYIHIKPNDGLTDSELRGLLCSDDGYLWVSTAHAGIFRIHPDTLEVTSFNDQIDLAGMEYNMGVGLKASDGTMYFGGSKGVAYLHEGKMMKNPYQAPLYVEDIVVEGEGVSTSYSRQRDSFQLEYWQNTIYLQFSALNYIFPGKNRYRYRMLGLTNDWTPPRTDRAIRFTNMQPGTYRFQVQSLNHFGVENRIEELVFTITPPVWRTWWFYTGVILISIGLLFFAYWLRIRHIEADNRRLESEVLSRTAQLKTERDYLKIFIDNSPLIIFAFDAKENLTYLNPMAVKTFQLPAVSERKMKWWQVVPKIEDREHLKRLRQEMSKQNLIGKEITLTLPPNQTRTLIWSLIHHKDKDGAYIETLVFASDATEHIENEIMRTSSREQKKIGIEIHDNICQTLTGVLFMCGALTKKESILPQWVEELILNIQHHLQDVTTKSRLLARGLYLHELEKNGLEEALRELTRAIENLYDIPCDFECADTLPLLDTRTATELYRIVQEAMTNAAKYSKSPRIHLKLEVQEELLSVTVRDMGIGFDVEERSQVGMGIGIMKNRARIIQAEVSFHSIKGEGTLFTCNLMLNNVLSDVESLYESSLTAS